MGELDLINKMIENVKGNLKKITDYEILYDKDKIFYIKTMFELEDEYITKKSNDGTTINQKTIAHNKKIIDVKGIHDELDKMKISSDGYSEQIDFIEHMIIQDHSSNNVNINSMAKAYDEVDERYKLGKNTSLARDILKFDSYDRNVEENFFIMYYLLSYGILGYFMYKLIKL
jgi:hypothetical protein